jgi:predicted nucleic acid-binding protein
MYRYGEIAICEVVELELLFSAENGRDFTERRTALESLPNVPIDGAVWLRATDVFQLLAETAPLHHRQVTLSDFLVAAAAEVARLTVIHYDRAFEVIAAVTKQPQRALAPLGSL